MSRMICYTTAKPVTTSKALGAGLLQQFAALAALHSDGWGTAWRDAATGTVRTRGGVTALDDPADLEAAVAEPSTARIVYLRFASRGAPPSPDNVQPFARDGLAFQHNGLLAPRGRLLELLSPTAREALRGDTDSEAYFAVVRERLAAGRQDAPSAQDVALGVGRVRSAFRDACVNAMILGPSTLHVVHVPGRTGAPTAAFAGRGWTADSLPPGHLDDYNALRTTASASGARVIATTGVDQTGWERLTPGMVFSVSPGGVMGTRI